jgi:hypothetical protein
MATYLNDLRLTELATGEGSGTWGTTTNTSLELIGEALGYATQQVFGSDADATTTIADGASDPARAMYFKITSAGSLTATRTCTIAPNTVSRVMFIENATTGSQSIAISQGSGASVTILTGKTAVVYLDGAGAGAAVVDAMAGVDPGVTDTLAEVLAAGNTSGANNLIIDNGQAITTNTINETTAASGVTIDSVLLKDDGVNATNLEITNLKANDGTSAGSIADSTGVVTLASSVLTTADINGGTIDGAVIGGTTPAALSATTGSFSSTLGVTGAATFSSTVAGAFNGTLGATTPASVAATTGSFSSTLGVTGAATFSSTVAGAFNGTLGATTPASVAATTGTFSGAITAGAFSEFTGGLSVVATDGIYLDGGGDTFFQEVSSNIVRLMAANQEVVRWNGNTLETTFAGNVSTAALTATTGTFSGAFTSLGIDDNADAVALTIDSSERALFGHSAAIQGTKVEISAVSDGAALGLFGRASDNLSYIGFYQNGAATRTGLIQANTADGLQFIGGSGGTVQMTLDASGRVTMPYQPAFLVLAATQNNIPINANTTVNFNNEVFDQGSNYAGTSFTAPVTGKYQLNLSLYTLAIDSAADYVQVAIVTSNRQYFAIVDPGVWTGNPAYWSFAITVLADMDASDTAHVEVQLNNTGAAQMDITANSAFSGYLVA